MVYFIQAKNSLVKIGKTTNLEKRLCDLRKEHGAIVLLATIPDAEDDGVYHSKFRDCWSSGEWFTPSPELRAFIEALPKSDECQGTVCGSVRNIHVGGIGFEFEREPDGSGRFSFDKVQQEKCYASN